MPSSGQAKAIHAAWYEFPLIDGLKGVVGTVFYAESALSFVVLGLVLIGLYSIWKNKPRSVLELSGFLLVASGVLTIITLIQLHGFRDWYLMPHYFLLLLLISFGIEWFLMSKNKYVFMLPLFLAILWGEAQWSPRSFNGPFVIASCEDVQKLVPEGSRVGVFNAGLPGACLGETHTVVNLDGVVNNGVLPYLRNRELSRYLNWGNIEFVFDKDESLNFFEEKASTEDTYILTHRIQVFYQFPETWRLKRVWHWEQ
ncbi:MAG: hypothetical protein Crog4KO_15790 [Crocinitomicaceae bacterium]